MSTYTPQYDPYQGYDLITFYHYMNSCPICGDWLNCITSVHAQKHGLSTALDFIHTHIPEYPGLTNLGVTKEAPIIGSTIGESAYDLTLRAMKLHPEGYISPSTIVNDTGLRIVTARRALTALESNNLVISKLVRIASSGSRYNVKHYKLC